MKPFQYGVRSTIAIMVAACVVLAWLQVKVNEGRKRAFILAEIKSQGGEVLYADQVEYSPQLMEYIVAPENSTRQASWLERMLGADFSEVAVVSITSPDFDDLSFVSSFPNLKDLSVGGTQVSNIDPVKSLRYLKILNIGNTPVSDIEPLRKLSELEVIELSNTNVTDISPLSNLHNLRALFFDRTEIVDVCPIANLAKLEVLSVGRSVKNLDCLKEMNGLEVSGFNR